MTHEHIAHLPGDVGCPIFTELCCILRINESNNLFGRRTSTLRLIELDDDVALSLLFHILFHILLQIIAVTHFYGHTVAPNSRTVVRVYVILHVLFELFPMLLLHALDLILSIIELVFYFYVYIFIVRYFMLTLCFAIISLLPDP